MVSTYSNPRLLKLTKYIFVLIIVLLPFHAFFTTWFASFTGGLLIWRAWKEFLLVIALISGLWFFWRDTTFRKTILSRKLNLVGLGFVVWILLVTLVLNHDSDSAISGLSIQVRLVAALLLGQLLSYYDAFTKKQLLQLVLAPGVAVVGFGLLQLTLLPKDFLSHFGYNKLTTIPPYFTIDEQQNKIRIASTLRGPNPLGVYLALPLLLTLSLFTKLKDQKAKIQVTILLICMVVVLYFSHSRGAWLGCLAGLFVYGLLSVSRKKQLVLLLAAAVLCLVGSFGVYQLRHTTFVEDVVFHDNPTEGGAVSSDQGHLTALKAGVQDALHHPFLGCGAGCAGPASVRYPKGPKIAENYYIQTVQESGLIGLALLLVFFVLVSLQLLKEHSRHSEARVLLAAFVAVSIASLLAHAWADDTIAYLWWGLAGYILFTSHPKHRTL